MDLAALISGGKDSLLALYMMHQEGHRIKYLLTMDTISRESYMFHHPNTWITELISESTGVPLIKYRTKGVKEEELYDLKRLLQKIASEVDGIISGAIASSYQKNRIDALCEELDLKSLAPLWHLDSDLMWNELLKSEFEVLITSVAAHGLNEKWLGKTIDEGDFRELMRLSMKYRFHLGFEGGEAETLVLDMPLYKKKIVVEDGEASWEGDSGVYVIKKAVLGDK
jgi:ABC transporter with metal-binding/Fe-S-binding domain ATP-binding protein